MCFKKLTLLILLLFSFMWENSYAQNTQGTDFWLAYLQNCDTNNEPNLDFYILEMTVSAQRACEVVIENDSLGFSKTISMEANSTQVIEIPFDMFNLNVYDKAVNKTLHVTSTDSVSVYISNSQHCSMECTLALPTQSWGSYYITQMGKIRVPSSYYEFFPAVFAIIASEDGTEVEITPSLDTGGGHPAGQPYTVTLNKGEVYAVESTSADPGKDFSGSIIRVKDDKTVAVYMGNRSANVPEPNPAGDADNLMEVCYPVSSWGQQFVVVPMKTSKNELIKCTASEKGATIYKDGEKIAELAPYESYEFITNELDGAFVLESSEPVEVYQYFTSSKYPTVPRTDGGPSFQYVAPVEQSSKNITFSTFNTTGVDNHFLNVIIKKEDKDLVTLDGKTNFVEFKELETMPDLLYASLSIEPGTHVLEAPNGVVANMYGTGYNISYAYSAGSNMSVINPQTGAYKVKYDGNGATDGKMADHVYEIGADETTQLDGNKYEKIHKVTFDTQGGNDIDDIESPCDFEGWLQDEFLTKTTNDWATNWTNAFPEYTKLTKDDSINVVNVSTQDATWERLYSKAVYMPKGNHTLKFSICSPTGYEDLTAGSEILQMAVCSTPQTGNSGERNYLTNGTNKSSVYIEEYDPSSKMVDKELTVYSTGEASYFSFNCGNIKDYTENEFRISPFVLYVNGESSIVLDDKANTVDLVREESGTITLKAQWECNKVELPLPEKEGYTFKGWNTESDGTGDSYSAGDEILVDTDIELFAMWEKIEIDCSDGTILFREDFGGNSVNDPLYGPALPDTVVTLTYSNHSWNLGLNGYGLRKEAVKRNDVDNPSHIYRGWYAEFGDHTHNNDLTRGYFMQIDLDYKEATFYRTRIDDLCENTNLTFSFWGFPVNADVDAPVTITIEDLKGNVLNQEKFFIDHTKYEWQNFELPFVVPNGQSSIIYKVYSGAGGNGGDFGLDDIEVRLCKPGVEVNKPEDSLCVGSDFTIRAKFTNDKNDYIEPINYTWFKNKQSGYQTDGWEKVGTSQSLELKNLQPADTGYYKVIISSAGVEGVMNKCNSASEAVPIFVKECSALMKDTICKGEDYSFGGKTLTESGTYVDSLQDNLGRDSVIYLDLLVLSPDTITINDTVLAGEPYNKYGFEISEVTSDKTEYVDSLLNVNGCDSIITLQLEVIDLSLSQNGPICEGEDIILTINGTFPDGKIQWRCPDDRIFNTDEQFKITNAKLADAGVYTLELVREDDNVTIGDISVEVFPKFEIDTTISIIKGEYYSFGSKNLSEAGNYSNTFKTVNGCDSIVNLKLVVREYGLIQNGPLCEGEDLLLEVTGLMNGEIAQWRGPNDELFPANGRIRVNNVTTQMAGDYVFEIINEDEIVVVDKVSVEVFPKFEIDTTITILEGETFIFDSSTLKDSGLYTANFKTVNGCDSIVNLTLIVDSIEVNVTTENNGPVCEGETLILDAHNIPNKAKIRWTGPNGFTSEDSTVTLNHVSLPESGEYKLEVILSTRTIEAPSTFVEIYTADNVTVYEKMADTVIYYNDLAISEPGEYTFNLKNEHGCDSIVTLYVQLDWESFDIIPDPYFTPDGDGIHERWYIEGVEKTPTIVKIFDRFGKLIRIYDPYTNNEGWDGKDSKGYDMPSADYWYLIANHTIDKYFVGHVTLLRR